MHLTLKGFEPKNEGKYDCGNDDNNTDDDDDDYDDKHDNFDTSF